MAKFRKKPVVIDAVQYGPYAALSPELLMHLDGCDFRMNAQHGLIIKTLEGEMCANLGDWIIMGVHGEFYPCKPDIFEKTYEPA